MTALPKLTASQELMMDLLVARHRLGEPFWPISTKLTRTYHELREKGYVSILHGHVEGTVRVMLTPVAVKELISDSPYNPRLMRDLAGDIVAYLEKKGGDATTIRMVRKKFAKES